MFSREIFRTINDLSRKLKIEKKYVIDVLKSSFILFPSYREIVTDDSIRNHEILWMTFIHTWCIHENGNVEHVTFGDLVRFFAKYFKIEKKTFVSYELEFLQCSKKLTV